MVALAACSSSTASDDTGGPPIQLVLRIVPADGTTRVGAAIPVVAISGIFTHDGLADPDVAQVVGGLSLVTYPEGAKVDATIVAVKATDAGQNVNLEVRPAAPLTDRWYALRLHAVPARMGLNYYSHKYRKLADGSLEARFRVGSEPSLLAIEFCAKGGTETVISFSEPVRAALPAPPFSLVYDDGSPAPHCDFSFALPPGGVDPDRRLNPVDSFQGLCTDLDSTKKARFIVGAGMTTVDGDAVPAATVTIDLPSLPASQPSCKHWFRSF